MAEAVIKAKESSNRYGSLPPKIGLREAVAIVTALYEQAGGEASLDELSEIMRNSRKSSTFSIKLGVLKKIDLVTADDEKIRLSVTGEKIVAPTDAAEYSAALKWAFLGNEVFEAIYDKYIGKILPQDEFLKNAFLEFTSKEFIEKWMEQFKDSARFAGLLIDRGDGKLQVRENAKVEASAPSASGPKKGDDPETSPATPPPVAPPPSSAKSNYQFLIEIMNADMSPEELEAVWTLLRYLKKKEAGFPARHAAESESSSA